jgi:4-alpha-glucanotransferase
MSEMSPPFRCRAFPERTAGVLLHLTALPGKGPVGSLGAGARHFVDFLAQAGFSWWQVCPLGPTGFGDSPYQALSVFAGNPYLLDLEDLRHRGFLTHEEIQSLQRSEEENTDYGRLWHELRPALQKAAERGVKILQNHSAFREFCRNEESWLQDWCRFSALRIQNQFMAPSLWTECKPDKELYQQAAVLQFLFSEQWFALKQYATHRRVKLIGDEPIYVSADGCDLWAKPELFQLDEWQRPKFVAGVPPDYFAEDGQLWGNPLYDWPRHAADHFAWWQSRVHHDLRLFDVIRIDHFRGICDYWSVPADAPNARQGEWREGPGIAFTQALGDLPLVAEDLGLLSPGVDVLRKAAQLPGMAVLQFGFSNPAGNPHHPANITPDRVVYTGTHDNDTVEGWMKTLSGEEQRHLHEALGHIHHPAKDLAQAALDSPGVCAIIAAQDLLELGTEARFNTPGNPQGNWRWRMTDDQLAHLFTQVEEWQYRLVKSNRFNG